MSSHLPPMLMINAGFALAMMCRFGWSLVRRPGAGCSALVSRKEDTIPIDASIPDELLEKNFVALVSAPGEDCLLFLPTAEGRRYGQKSYTKPAKVDLHEVPGPGGRDESQCWECLWGSAAAPVNDR